MKKKIDVLFLCQYFYPEYVSSATLPYDTAKALVKAGFTVSVICGYPYEYNKDGKVPLEELHEGIKIKRVKYLQLNNSSFVGRLINYFSFTLSVFLRFFSLKKYSSIIVYSNPPILPIIAAWSNKVFKTKMIFVSYDVYPEIAHITNSISTNGPVSWTMQFINKKVFSNASKVVALSNEMKTFLVRNRKQIQESQIEVIPNWCKDIATENISRSYSNSAFFNLLHRDNLVVSYFGNMGICQDLDTILGAIRMLKNDSEIKFVFAGHGNKMQKLRKTIDDESLKNVVVFDFLHGKDFQDALNISDVFLVSLADGLTGLAVPSKTYSYMRAGKPVIAIMGKHSDVSKELLENDAGYVVEVGEVEQLVRSIKKLKDNVELRAQMGSNIHRIFKNKYTTEKCTQLYVNMMKQVLEDGENV